MDERTSTRVQVSAVLCVPKPKETKTEMRLLTTLTLGQDRPRRTHESGIGIEQRYGLRRDLIK